jgi:hypothetical protein
MEKESTPDTTQAERKLPTLLEIVSGDIPMQAKQAQLSVLLNQKPPETWLKKHPMAASVTYIPIDKIEYLLTSIFLNWHVEIRQVQTIANSAVVTVRLFYVDPISGLELWQDGVGAAPIHTKSGKGAMDWNEVNTDSVMKSVPAAESYAVKDAAEKIGRIFGKDLNRKDLVSYEKITDRFKGAKITEK